MDNHQETVDLFTVASAPQGVPDADLRAWAGLQLPALKAHLQEAQALYATVNK